MDLAASSHFATRAYRETNVSLFSTCTTTAANDGEPVMPPPTTYQRMLAAQPQACPACGSGEIAPLFEGDWWDCQGGHRWEARAFAALHEED